MSISVSTIFRSVTTYIIFQKAQGHAPVTLALELDMHCDRLLVQGADRIGDDFTVTVQFEISCPLVA
ncbi:MAG: hypothetical protein ABI456_14160 [Ktedonobacteraceae bacterium]|nr:hypothetical protein [Chloroflexota bacterium]